MLFDFFMSRRCGFFHVNMNSTLSVWIRGWFVTRPVLCANSISLVCITLHHFLLYG